MRTQLKKIITAILATTFVLTLLPEGIILPITAEAALPNSNEIDKIYDGVDFDDIFDNSNLREGRGIYLGAYDHVKYEGNMVPQKEDGLPDGYLYPVRDGELRPILWRVVGESENEPVNFVGVGKIGYIDLYSVYLLDTKPYAYPNGNITNKYKDSYIRNYLNSTGAGMFLHDFTNIERGVMPSIPVETTEFDSIMQYNPDVSNTFKSNDKVMLPWATHYDSQIPSYSNFFSLNSYDSYNHLGSLVPTTFASLLIPWAEGSLETKIFRRGHFYQNPYAVQYWMRSNHYFFINPAPNKYALYVFGSEATNSAVSPGSEPGKIGSTTANTSSGVRPIIRLDPKNIISTTEVVANVNSLDQQKASHQYPASAFSYTSTDPKQYISKYYKLTLHNPALTFSNLKHVGSDVKGKTVAAAPGSTLELSANISTVYSNSSINYKIVSRTTGKIVGSGVATSKASTTNTLKISLTDRNNKPLNMGNYSVYAWHQRNNDINSHEGSTPIRFNLNISNSYTFTVTGITASGSPMTNKISVTLDSAIAPQPKADGVFTTTPAETPFTVDSVNAYSNKIDINISNIKTDALNTVCTLALTPPSGYLIKDCEKFTFTITRPANTYKLYYKSGNSVVQEDYKENAVVLLKKGEDVFDASTVAGRTFVDWNTNPNGTGNERLANEIFFMPRENLTLYAQWKTEPPSTSVVVKYNIADGNVIESTPRKLGSSFSPMTLDTDQYPQGMVFKEWNTKNDGSGTSYTPGKAYALTEDVVSPQGTATSVDFNLYAIWAEGYPVTYDLSGHSIIGNPPTETPKIVGEAFNAAEEPFILNFTKRFKEWNTAADGKGIGYEPGATVTMPNYPLTLYAIWSPLYTLRYDSNGGQQQIASVARPHAEGDTFTTNSSARITAPYDMVFKEWNTEQDGSGTAYLEGETVVMPGKDLTLYAIWVPIAPPTYHITYSANGGSGSFPSESSKEAGEFFTIASAEGLIPPSNMMFKEWNSKDDGTGTSYAPNMIVTMPANDLALYAVWMPIPETMYRVTYNLNGGAGDLPAERQRGAGELFTVVSAAGLTPPSGMMFKEWNTQANGTGTRYAPNAVISMSEADLMLYAIWAPAPITRYNVVYHANGGDGTAPTETDKAVGELFNIASADGLTPPNGMRFKEWNTADDGSGTRYAAGTSVAMPEANLMLYAIWSRIPLTLYSVTYNPNSGTGNVPIETDKQEGTTFVASSADGLTPPNGMQFKEWNTAGNGTGTRYAAGDIITMPSGNLELYAIWEDIPPINMTLFVQTEVGDIFTLDNVSSIDTIGALKAKIEQVTQIPTYGRELTFNGASLTDDTKLVRDCHIQDNSMLYLAARLTADAVLYVGTGGQWSAKDPTTVFDNPQDAIDQAARIVSETDGTVYVLVGIGTYTPKRMGSGEAATDPKDNYFTLRTGVTVIGGFSGDEDTMVPDYDRTSGFKTVFSGQGGATSVFYIDNSEHSGTLQNAVISDGNGGRNHKGGGMYVNYGSVTLINCTFENNKVFLDENNINSSGGGMYINYGSATLTGCHFLNNSVVVSDGTIILGGSGGGLSNNRGSVTLTGCVFEGNTANGGGGGMSTIMPVVLTDCTFKDNKALNGYGGGLNCSSRATLTNCTFQNNTADSGGGGLSGTVFTLTNCTFEDNQSTSSGGGVYSFSASTLTNCTFRNNTAGSRGGGLYLAARGIVVGCTFDGNTANTGGAVYAASVNLSNNHSVFVNCVLTNNTATTNSTIYGGGGGMYLEDTRESNSHILLGCYLENNTTNGISGGIYSFGNLTLSGCTLLGNSATSSGGVEVPITNATLTIENSIITLNTVTGGGTSDADIDSRRIDEVKNSIIGSLYYDEAGASSSCTPDSAHFINGRLQAAASYAINKGDHDLYTAIVPKIVEQYNNVFGASLTQDSFDHGDIDGNSRAAGKFDIGAFILDGVPVEDKPTPSAPVVTATANGFPYASGDATYLSVNLTAFVGNLSEVSRYPFLPSAFAENYYQNAELYYKTNGEVKPYLGAITVSSIGTNTYEFYCMLDGETSDSTFFTVNIDQTPPQVNLVSATNSMSESSSPVTISPSGTENVPVSGKLDITFSEQMSPNGAVTLNGQMLWSSRWNEDQTVYTLDYTGLDMTAEYVLSISGFKDTAGNLMSAVDYHFTTVGIAPGFDNVPSSLGLICGYDNVSVPLVVSGLPGPNVELSGSGIPDEVEIDGRDLKIEPGLSADTYEFEIVAQNAAGRTVLDFTLLVAAADLGRLPELIDEAQGLITAAQALLDEIDGGLGDLRNGDYPPAAIEALKEGVIAAQAVVDDENHRTPYVVADAIEALEADIEAFRNSIVRVDYSELAAVLEIAKSIERGRYSAVSWNALQIAIADMVSLIENNKATQAEIAAAEAIIRSAIDALQTVSTGGGTSARYTVTFNVNGGSDIPKQTVERSGKVSRPADPRKEGNIFVGWFVDEELTKEYDFTTFVNGNLTLYASWKEGEQDLQDSFIGGYPDGTFRPDNSITRAEVVQILYNMSGGGATTDLSVLSEFVDVASSHWAANVLAWAVEQGYFSGYKDNTLRPDNNITRAELAVILHRAAQKQSLFGEVGMANASFIDIDGHWAQYDIIALAYKGIAQGYPDGSFGPENDVTRAEAVVMIARLFGRTDKYTNDKSFSDITESHWAYPYVMNAVNGSR